MGHTDSVAEFSDVSHLHEPRGSLEGRIFWVFVFPSCWLENVLIGDGLTHLAIHHFPDHIGRFISVGGLAKMGQMAGVGNIGNRVRVGWCGSIMKGGRNGGGGAR